MPPLAAVLNAVGGAVAGMEADTLFRERGRLVAAVQGGLHEVLCGHGFALADCLITVGSTAWRDSNGRQQGSRAAGRRGSGAAGRGCTALRCGYAVDGMSARCCCRPPRTQVLAPTATVKEAMSGVKAAQRRRETALEEVAVGGCMPQR